MPSPYGQNRSAASYYEYGGVPRHYILNWDGLPPGPTRAAETRGLGCDGEGDYIDVVATAHLHKSLGDYPVAMSLESGTRSILHSGPEQTKLYDGLGLFDLSRNEQRLAVVAGLGLAAYFAWKKWGKKGRR